MRELHRQRAGDKIAIVAHSTRADGDLAPSTVDRDTLLLRRQQAVPHPWRAVRQVHSDRVIHARHDDVSAGLVPAGLVVADALVTADTSLVVAAHSGDCVPVGFINSGGAVGVAHAGWKGLEAGVLESTARSVRTLASEDASQLVVAIVGPHIRAERYEFGDNDLDRLTARFGPATRSMTATGQPALDLTAAIAHELDRLNVDIVAQSPDCTAREHELYWSHRARQEPGRIALVAWLEDLTVTQTTP